MSVTDATGRWPVKAALAVLIVVGALVLLRTIPPTPQSFYPKCMLHQWTGLHCAGCGGTRAVAALSKGHIAEAFRMNPLLIAGTPVFALMIFFQRRREQRSKRLTPSISWLIASVVIIYSVARNVPSPSSSPLAPPAGESVDDAKSGLIPFGIESDDNRRVGGRTIVQRTITALGR